MKKEHKLDKGDAGLMLFAVLITLALMIMLCIHIDKGRVYHRDVKECFSEGLCAYDSFAETTYVCASCYPSVKCIILEECANHTTCKCPRTIQYE